MPDYKELYLTLFRETTKAITMLQKAQQKAEEAYINAGSTEIRVLEQKNQKDIIDIMTPRRERRQ